MYKHESGIFFFHDSGEYNTGADKSDNLIFQIKSLIKKSPKLFYFLNHTLGIHAGKSVKDFLRNIPKGALIINLGSGSNIIRDDVINLDSYPYPGVKIVSDVHKLPFKDASVDVVVAESLLEHVKNPEAVVKEIYRVLKPGGTIYITTPFIIGFHSSPDDYYRWTYSGLRILFKDFKEIELGSAVGPTVAFTYILREWLAVFFSFNSAYIYQLVTLFLMFILAPLNLLDFILIKYKISKNIAHIFYFVGKK